MRVKHQHSAMDELYHHECFLHRDSSGQSTLPRMVFPRFSAESGDIGNLTFNTKGAAYELRLHFASEERGALSQGQEKL